MKIDKIKMRKLGFADGSGPYEIVTLGINIDDIAIPFGDFGFGFGVGRLKENEEIFDKLDAFLNKCEILFKKE